MPPPDELPPVAGAKLAPDVTCAGSGLGSGARQRGAGFLVTRDAETPEAVECPSAEGASA